jgi:hypothetical protein
MQSMTKSFLLAIFLILSGSAVAQTDSAATFDGLHYKLLNDYLQFVDTLEKKPITESYFRVRARKHVSIIDFNDGRHFYTIHKKIKIYRSGMRYEKIKWFLVKGSFYKKLYVIKTVGQDYRYIQQYSYNTKLRRTKKIICVDDNYLKVHVYRPEATRGIKTYLKRESSLPASHQN